MTNFLDEIKASLETELAGVSGRLRGYITTLEEALKNAEEDAKSRWMYYAIVAFVSALIGHKL